MTTARVGTLGTGLIGTGMLCLVAYSAPGASLLLSGDLGSTSWFQSPGMLTSGNSIMMPFVHNFAGRGSLQGDVLITHAGNMFSMSITNFAFRAFDWSPTGFTDVRLVLTQAFDCLPGNYAATQALDGVMDSSTLGCVAIANTILDSGATDVFLPVVSYGSGPGGPQPFSVGPTFGMTTITHPDILIKMQLDLRIFGDGIIILPSSFDTVTIPAPGSALAGLLVCAVAGRRRRR